MHRGFNDYPMDTLRFEHLMKIAVTEVASREDVVKGIAERYHERYLAAAKGFAGTAATILTSILIPWFGQPKTFDEFRISWYSFLFCLGCSLLSFLAAVQYAKRYAETLRAVDRLTSIRGLLQSWGY